MDFAAVGGGTVAFDQALGFHAPQLLQGGGLHDAEAATQVALGEPVFLPQRAQEIPHPDR